MRRAAFPLLLTVTAALLAGCGPAGTGGAATTSAAASTGASSAAPSSTTSTPATTSVAATTSLPATAVPPVVTTFAPAASLVGRTVVLDPGHNGANGANPDVVNRLVPAG